MDNTNTMLVAATEIMPSIIADTGDVVSKLTVAMLHMKDHWLVTDDAERFATAVSTVMQYCSDNNMTEDLNRIKWEMDSSNKLLSGDISQIMSVDMDKYEPIGLLKMWRRMR